MDRLTSCRGRARCAFNKSDDRPTPDVPSDPDVNSLIPELRERLADPRAIEHLRKEIFPTGKIYHLALQASIWSDEAQSDEMT